MSEGRPSLETVLPRMYVALPAVGEVDVQLNQEDSPVERRFIADLILFYAFDVGTHYQLVANRDLDRMNINDQELHRRAISNLRALNPEARAHSIGNVMMIASGGNTEATLILLPEIADSLSQMVQGVLTVSIPARDILLVTGDATQENLAELRRLTSRALEKADHPLSRNFLQWNGAIWTQYDGFAS